MTVLKISIASYGAKVTTVFADSRITLLCCALCIYDARAPTESCPFSLLVHWAFRACYESHLPLLHHASLPQVIYSNVHSGAAALSASMMLLCCLLASSSFTSENLYFCQMIVWPLGCIVFDDFCWHYAIWPPIPNTIFIKHRRVEIIALPFVLFHSNRFFNVYCLFRQQFSAAYLLKIFLLPQRAHTTRCIRGDKPELTHWCLCSLYAGIQMSPDEVVGSREGCRNSIAESTVDVPMRLFWQFFSARTALFSCPFAWSTAYIWSLFDFCKPFGCWNDPCNCHHFSPFMSPRDARVVQILP